MDTFWSETWTGASGPWPSSWSSSNAAATTIASDKGRITAGPGSYTSTSARFEGMGDQRDANLLVSFTVNTNIEWYLSVGLRTASNDPGADTSFATRGVYARIGSLLGNFVEFWTDNGSGSAQSLGGAGLAALTVGATYRVRFRAEGTRLRVRVWNAAGAEPATWDLDVTNPDGYLGAGKASLALLTNTFGDVQYIDVDDLTVAGLDPVLPGPNDIVPPPRVWTMWSRAADNSPDVALPIASIKVLKRHMGLRTAVVQTKYTPERWLSVQASRGILLYRNGVQEFSGPVVSRKQIWDAGSGELRIRIEAAGDELHLADRTVFPDPLRAADDQIVNDYWMTRVAGAATAKVASTAMIQLISDQAGPTCRADRRVPGLVLGADPAIGLSRIWSGLFNAEGENGVLDQLRAIANASGEDLGLRVTSDVGSLTADVVEPRDLTDAVRFSADLRNLVGYEYEERAPTCTHALVAGQGDLHLRLRKLVVTASGLALSWGRQVWKYLDRRDTADVAELTKEGADAVVEGDATVSLVVTLTDSQAATYGETWDLGDAITIYVAPPRQGTSITVSDVVREVLLEVDDRGVEKVTPAVGTPDATVRPTSREQQRLADIGSALGGLTRK